MSLEAEFKDNAEAHWKWLETWLHLVYVDAMLHGYKHGVESRKPFGSILIDNPDMEETKDWK